MGQKVYRLVMRLVMWLVLLSFECFMRLSRWIVA